MPPGTPHAVFNITDCIAEGGHMFMRPSLRKSFDIGLREHLLGHKDTNTTHADAEIILHGIWAHFYLGITAQYKWMKRSWNDKAGEGYN